MRVGAGSGGSADFCNPAGRPISIILVFFFLSITEKMQVCARTYVAMSKSSNIVHKFWCTLNPEYLDMLHFY